MRRTIERVWFPLTEMVELRVRPHALAARTSAMMAALIGSDRFGQASIE